MNELKNVPVSKDVWVELVSRPVHWNIWKFKASQRLTGWAEVLGKEGMVATADPDKPLCQPRKLQKCPSACAEACWPSHVLFCSSRLLALTACFPLPPPATISYQLPGTGTCSRCWQLFWCLLLKPESSLGFHIQQVSHPPSFCKRPLALITLAQEPLWLVKGTKELA